MKKPYAFPLLIFISLAALSARLCADEETATAKVISIAGAKAQVQLAGGELRALQPNETLPQGATIVTGAETTVVIEPINGTASSVQPDSRVVLEKLSLTTEGGKLTKQAALLNLQSGAVANVLDASKKAINDLSVRVGDGIAKARGTTFAASINDNGALGFIGKGGTVTTGSGEVSWTFPDGSGVVIKNGQTFGKSANGTLAPVTLDVTVYGGILAAIANVAAKAAANPAAYGIDPATAQAE